jgi:hypothetical protein
MVRLTSAALHEQRNFVHTLLGTIAAPPNRVHCERSSLAGNQILAAHDGTKLGASYRDWRFSLVLDGLRASYFELWSPANRADHWALRQAYLHVYALNRISARDRELVALHCDPLEPLDPPTYKRGPHVHVKVSPEPLSHAHLSLVLGFEEQVLQNAQSFRAALIRSVRMVKTELIDRIEAGDVGGLADM